MAHDQPTVVVRGGAAARSSPAPHEKRDGGRAPRILARGTGVGRYLTIDSIGTGGMGAVYSAYDPELGRKVAVKVLRVGAGDESLSAGRARLIREAQALARLSHPNVIPVYDVGPHEDGVFMAMELVDGGTLRAWRAEGARGWREVRDVYLLAGAGLAAAHEARLVHRDFKPENVLVGKDGRVRVTDFGLARDAVAVAAVAPAPPPDEVTPAPWPFSPITLAGQLIGTPPYMPPELLEGKTADARSDQWSFCAALYEALYGEHPFKRASIDEQYRAVHAGEVNAAPARSGVPPWLRRAVVRGLAPDPEDRWPSLPELLRALERDRRYRRRDARALLIGAVTALAAVGLVGRSEEKGACTGAGAMLRGIWDDRARAGLVRSFNMTGLSYAADAAAATRQALDGYAASWVAMHGEACRATEVLHIQPAETRDARMLCLNRRLGELDRVARMFRRADGRTVEHAAEAALRLPPIADCVAADMAAADGALPATLAAKVAAARGRIDDAHALRATGKVLEARVLADQVALEAQALAYPPLVGEALLSRGALEARMGEARRAQRTLSDAAGAALSAGDARTACDAWTELTDVSGRDLSAFDEALRWGTMAEAAARRLEPRGRRSADVARTLGLVYQLQGRYDDAETSFRRALALRTELVGPEHFEVGVLHNDLGNVARMRGDGKAAAEELDRALAIERRALGEHHPALAPTYVNLATIAIDDGRYPDALRYGGEVLALRERSLGPQHPDVGRALALLAVARQGLGQMDEALALYRRALAIAERPGAPVELDVAEALTGMGSALHRTGDFEGALAANRRAAEIRGRLLGPDHPETAVSHANQGIELKSLGRYAEAAQAYAAALVVFEKALGPDHPNVGIMLDNQGEVLRLTGDAAAGLASYQRSIEVLEKSLGKYNAVIADPLTGLGRCQTALGRAKLAVPPLERALAMREAGPDDPNLAETRFALAVALSRSGGDRVRARGLAERSLATYRAAGPSFDRQRREVEGWLR